MKRSIRLSLTVVMLAGCTESPVGVIEPSFDHAGPDNASFTLPAPVITSTAASGTDVTIEWEWSFADHGWDLVSFKVERDGVELGASVANAKPYGAAALLERSITDAVPGPGTYEYCVEVMAKDDPIPGQGQPMTYHGSACVDVVVASYTIVITGGSAQSGSFNRNANNFTLSYELRLGGAVVTDCAVAVTVQITPSTTVQQHNCDGVTGTRNLVIANPTKGTAVALTIEFYLGASELLELAVASS